MFTSASNYYYYCCNGASPMMFPFLLTTVDSHELLSPKICHGCSQPIEDEFSMHVSPNLEWHAACLMCAECREFLDETCETCFIKDGRPYCRKDYTRSVQLQRSA